MNVCHTFLAVAATVQEPIGYLQRWRCSEFEEDRHSNVHAFVDGGMIYNQTDKSLYVQTCGYYSVTSQIMFHLTDKSRGNITTVSHFLKFQRNCQKGEISDYTAIARSSIHYNGEAITRTGDVIKLCAGGRIWVEILQGPDTFDVPCCPVGEYSGTFLSAVLVAETSCDWPPN